MWHVSLLFAFQSHLLRFVLAALAEKITDLLTSLALAPSLSLARSPSLSLSLALPLALAAPWQMSSRRNLRAACVWGAGAGLAAWHLQKKSCLSCWAGRVAAGRGGGLGTWGYNICTPLRRVAVAVAVAVLKIFQVARSFGRSRWPPVRFWSRLG